MSAQIVLDLFAGPGGWDEGVRPLGIRPVGVEWDKAACLTAVAAGHTRVRADVEQLPTEPMVGKVVGLIASPPCQDFSLAGKQAGITGEKGKLITQVLRWTDALRPRWVACEQVPPCLDLWHEYAAVMRGWGYKTWVGIVNAADYGVPQTRKRAILLASLDRQPTRPATTHAKGGDVDLFTVREPWVSMASALGWGEGASMRQQRGAGMAERHGERPDRTSGEPAFTIGTGVQRQKLIDRGDVVYVNGTMPNAARRSASEPAPTVMFGHAGNDVRWAYDRPSTTVVGSFCPDVIAAPGYRTEVSRQDAPGSVRVTVQEAGILQSFPPDYPWQGSRTKQYEQCGNAVPPRLALHVVAEVLGVPVPAEAVAA